MHAFYLVFFRFIITASMLFIFADTNAQNTPDTGLHPSVDSAQIKKAKERIKRRYRDSISYESDTVVALLLRKIEDLTELVNTANRISDRSFDTIDIAENLPETEELLNIIAANYVSGQTVPNLRSLKTAKGLLTETEKKLEGWQETLFKYSDELAAMKVNLSEMVKDSVLRKTPEDSLLRELYFSQLASLALRWKQTEAINNKNLFRIGLLQNRVAGAHIKSKDLLDRTNEGINKYIQKIWKAEEPSLFTLPAGYHSVPVAEVLNSSWQSFSSMIVFYASLNSTVWATGILGALILWIWFIWLLRKISKQHLEPADIKKNANLIAKKSFLTALGLVLVFISFFFFNLPSSWTTSIWCTIAVVFYFLNAAKTTRHHSYSLEFLIIFIVVNILGVLYKSTFAERWFEFFADIGLIAYGIFMIRKISKQEEYYPSFAKNVFILFTLFTAGALVANAVGCFMLSKSLNNGAVYAVMTAHVLFITTGILIQLIYILHEAYKENRLASYFDFYNIQQTLSKSLRIAAITGWLIVMARQLNFYDYGYEWFSSFLTTERKLGNNTFTFSSVLVFILVIWLSSFLSKLIIVFFGDNKLDSRNRKSRWSSMLILLRLGILSAGILIAFAVAGIPMDKLTIIIGALGVGIGFGLQNIVNNLVSGIILAFEKPVQIGDSIEVGTRAGIVKEIGIRSSKILTPDGSEVIVPNGDMLSQHIVNWTLSSHFRRVELMVGVAYSSDLRRAENILQTIIAEQNDIEKNPEPMVVAHQFGESSITFRLLFWCDIDKWVAIKSEVLIKVHQGFAEQGIEIPFPQREINIKDIDKLIKADILDEQREK